MPEGGLGLRIGFESEGAGGKCPAIGETYEHKHYSDYGRGQDVAELADYLISAGFVTGQNFTADGGMTKKMIYSE
jgi:NAD(P)-dependent dehydrogenase (short-subunit alcohol dehydrogenase family)